MLALGRFRRERGFDKKIDWYSRMATHLAKTKLDIEVARTIQEDAKEGDDTKSDCWRQVQSNYLALILLEAESKLYAPPEVVAAMRTAREKFDFLSDQTNGFDVAELPNHIPEVSQLTDAIDVAMNRHVAAVRKDFNFEPIEEQSG